VPLTLMYGVIAVGVQVCASAMEPALMAEIRVPNFSLTVLPFW